MSADKDREETIALHVQELRRMAAAGEITDAEHDVIGSIMCKHIGHLIGLSDKAWQMFTKIVNESREVHYNR